MGQTAAPIDDDGIRQWSDYREALVGEHDTAEPVPPEIAPRKSCKSDRANRANRLNRATICNLLRFHARAKSRSIARFIRIALLDLLDESFGVEKRNALMSTETAPTDP